MGEGPFSDVLCLQTVFIISNTHFPDTQVTEKELSENDFSQQKPSWPFAEMIFRNKKINFDPITTELSKTCVWEKWPFGKCL